MHRFGELAGGSGWFKRMDGHVWGWMYSDDLLGYTRICAVLCCRSVDFVDFFVMTGSGTKKALEASRRSLVMDAR